MKKDRPHEEKASAPRSGKEKYLLLGEGIILGLVIGGIFAWSLKPVAATVTALRESKFTKNQYSFINPLLAVDRPETLGVPAYEGKNETIEQRVKDFIAQGDADTVTLYFKDLTTGKWFDINPDEKYNPASMFKVPVMMAYFKYSEENPAALSGELTDTTTLDQNAQENIPSPVQIEKNKPYTIEDLVGRMIQHSDNNAATLLINHLNTLDFRLFNQPLQDMGVDSINTTDDYMTIKDYSLFFRLLYNATFLSWENSEKALDILTHTDFNKGITRDIPQTIPVAHKFGEFTIADTSGAVLKRELHDCGIVYDPGHPYLLCIMTKGKDFSKLEDVLAGLSSSVYKNLHP